MGHAISGSAASVSPLVLTTAVATAAGVVTGDPADDVRPGVDVASLLVVLLGVVLVGSGGVRPMRGNAPSGVHPSDECGMFVVSPSSDARVGVRGGVRVTSES